MDVHVPYAVTHGLRQAGIDVLTAQEDGGSEWPDEALLDRATALERTVFTYDRDFLREATRRQKAGHFFAGVITTGRKKLPLQQCLDDLTLACEVYDPKEMSNQVLYLPL